MDHDLPSRIRQARQELKLNRTEASVEWGLRPGTLSSWENNRRRPSASALSELNRILDSILGAPPREPADEPSSPRAPESFAQTGLRHAGEGRRVNPPSARPAESPRAAGGPSPDRAG